MTAFEIFLYAAAALFVLWVRAGAPLPTDTAAPEVEPQPVPAQPAVIAAPAAIARVEVEANADTWIADLEVEQPTTADYLATWSAQELRKECSRRGIAWRGVREGKHLTKAQMVEALA
jgi:hypothetical protein